MRLRLRYTKQGKLRFLSHRDVARVWERAWRKAGLPITYTEGHTPRPKVHFGLALPTGSESLAEYLDVDVPDAAGEDLDPEALPALLSGALPEGLEVQAAAVIPTGTPSLQEAVESCTWEIDVHGVQGGVVTGAVQRLLDAETVLLERERKGRTSTDDIRGLVRSLAVTAPVPGGVRLTAELGTQPRGLRPSELVAALDPSFEMGRVCRIHQWTSPGGTRREPLELPATRAPHASERAS